MSQSLVLAGVRLPRGDRQVLAGVDARLTVPMSVAVVGPSGAGKTTLLAVIAGLLRPDAGTVLYDGAPIDPRSVAWIMQTTPLLTTRTALDNVALGALANGSTHAAARAAAREILVRLDMGRLAGTPVRRLSGGERQRVVVARAVAQDAQLVLADEPTASLDATSRDQVVEALLAVEEAGRLLIVATHDRAVAERCSSVLSLCDGRVR